MRPPLPELIHRDANSCPTPQAREKQPRTVSKHRGTALSTKHFPRTCHVRKAYPAMSHDTPAPAPSPRSADVWNQDQGGRCPIFIPANWNPHYDEGVLLYADAEHNGPVSSTWAYDEGFRYEIEDGPGELTPEQAYELLGQLAAALAAARAAGHRIAEGIVAELYGRRERIAPADLTIPDRDVDGTLLDFELSAYGPVTTSWHPEDGFNYSIDHSLHLDPASARALQGALERVLRDNAKAKQRMDDTVAAWHRGEDVHAPRSEERPQHGKETCR